jgi:chromosome segregation ATPase
MKGTQLQQLSDEYSITLENIRSTNKVLEQKREAIPDLRATAQEAKRRYDEADNARKQKAKQDDLKKEMAWAHVQSKQDELLQKEAQVANLESKLPKLTAEIEQAKVGRFLIRRRDLLSLLAGDFHFFSWHVTLTDIFLRLNGTKPLKISPNMRNL